MRASALAVLSLVSAAVGAALVLVIATGTGWIEGSTTTLYVADSSRPGGSEVPAAVRSAAKPLPGNGFDPAKLYAERADGVVTIFARSGGSEAQGSGFVVSDDGVILTNSHVITNAGEGSPATATKGADDVFVEFRDGDIVPAEIVGFDLFDDVGVLRVDPELHAVEPLPLGDSSRVVVGEPVAAIGSPFGAESSLAVGVVSATQRAISALTSEYLLVDAIQTDAPINRGNSGGPLFDARGRVIGINAQIRSESGVNEGVGFAIPINSVKRSLDELLADGRVDYAYVGISTDDLTPALARELKLPVHRGALIVNVNAGPGRRAGLRGSTREIEFSGRSVRVGGDVVTAIDGRPVTSGDDLVRIVSHELRPGNQATFTVLRDSRFVNLSVRLGERPIVPPRD